MTQCPTAAEGSTSIHEYPPPGTVLLRRPPWRHNRGGAQYPVWDPTAGRQRPGRPVGGVLRGDTFSTAAVHAQPGRAKAVSVHPAFFLEPGGGSQRPARGARAPDPDWSVHDRAEGP